FRQLSRLASFGGQQQKPLVLFALRRTGGAPVPRDGWQAPATYPGGRGSWSSGLRTGQRPPYETLPGAPRQATSRAGSFALPRPAPRPLLGRLSRRLCGRLGRPASLERVRLGRRLKEVVAADAEGPRQGHDV